MSLGCLGVGQMPGYVTWAVTQGSCSGGSCLSLKLAASILTFFIIYEPSSVHFYFAVGCINEMASLEPKGRDLQTFLVLQLKTKL